MNNDVLIKTNLVSFMDVGIAFGDRAHSSFAPSQWETVLLCNDVSHWLGARLESALGELPLTVGHAPLNSSLFMPPDFPTTSRDFAVKPLMGLVSNSVDILIKMRLR